MKKEKSIPIVPVIFAIIAIVVIVIVLTKMANNGTSKLSNVYNEMVANQTYIFTRYDFEEKNKWIIYRKVDKTLIDMYNSGNHFSTLILEGNTYLISHPNKEYFIYSNTSQEEEILTENLKNIIALDYTTGKEKIYGKTYKYEEYEGVSEFLISTVQNIDTIKTRFYFSGDELVYLKTIYSTVNSETQERIEVEELQTIQVEYEVNDSIFEIPADYAEN